MIIGQVKSLFRALRPQSALACTNVGLSFCWPPAHWTSTLMPINQSLPHWWLPLIASVVSSHSASHQLALVGVHWSPYPQRAILASAPV